ncbi:hypothetical protein Nepgr_023368 [Nepenthes gracilis]|uniref:Uncharacterized protein n=1 Tax=Nepenthes gracilis TaxID=150966 RepID=A0AAD3XZC2_NEPGR|nr:hypothetical protein Nepgr_023368 [Nepenthes gracilis]
MYPTKIGSPHTTTKVKARQLTWGTSIPRGVEATGNLAGRNKLSPNWEGPFLVSTVLQNGAYKPPGGPENRFHERGTQPTSDVTSNSEPRLPDLNCP